MSTQPKVQRLVEDLSYVAKYSDSEHWATLAEAASELRRLVAQRDALLAALHSISLAAQDSGSTREGMGLYARAAIAKAEENP